MTTSSILPADGREPEGVKEEREGREKEERKRNGNGKL